MLRVYTRFAERSPRRAQYTRALVNTLVRTIRKLMRFQAYSLCLVSVRLTLCVCVCMYVCMYVYEGFQKPKNQSLPEILQL